MLTHMGIKNFALIESMSVDFSKGNTIFTGETGAGKSILMDALSILLGERASVDFIRHEKDAFLIEGVFDITGDSKLAKLLASKHIEVEEDTLILSRTFNRQGKSSILANDQPIPLKALREIGTYLADIHGQYSNQQLLKPETHHEYLDDYTEEAQKAYETYRAAYDVYKETKSLLEKNRDNAAERARELDMLRFQIDDIEEANLVIGEDKQLEKELEKMDNYEHLHQVLSSAYDAIYEGNHPLIDGLSTLESEISDLTKYDSDLEEAAELLKSSYFQLEEAASAIDRYRDGISYDEERYAYVQARDTLIYELKRKYGDSIEAILDFEAKAQERLDTLESETFEQGDLEKKLDTATKVAKEALKHLEKMRAKHANEIAKHLKEQLSKLGMAKAELIFAIEPSEELTPLGAKSIELLFCANKGEAMLPLAKVASGGEIARIALAFKSVFHRATFKTLVFDEIDVGISGDVALQVAQQILQLSIHNQVFCITHLPQTASIAEHHYHLAKEEVDGRTISYLRSLSEEEHITQIAKMMSGAHFSAKAMATAKEMVEHFNVTYHE